MKRRPWFAPLPFEAPAQVRKAVKERRKAERRESRAVWLQAQGKQAIAVVPILVIAGVLFAYAIFHPATKLSAFVAYPQQGTVWEPSPVKLPPASSTEPAADSLTRYFAAMTRPRSLTSSNPTPSWGDPAPWPTGLPTIATVDATALCNDGELSYSTHHQGTCSHHGGVAEWYR